MVSSTTMPPGGATASSRDAVFTTSPTMPSRSWSVRFICTIASPVVTAIRTVARAGVGLIESYNCLLDAESCPHGPLGIILMGRGDPKHGKDSVAEEFLDTPVVTLYLFAYMLVIGGEAFPNILGVGPLGVRGEPGEVSKEGSNDAAFLASGANRRWGEDLLGSCLRCRCHRGPGGRTAVGTEVGPVREFLTTSRTGEGDLRPAVHAELGPFERRGPACRTECHPRSI